MNIRDLEYAVAVADFGHFGQAAEACHVSQPALSGQIQKLERELGVTLFERTNRSVRVTAAGDDILLLARELLEQAGAIRQTADAFKDPLAGRLRLGMIPTIGPYLTPALLPSVKHHLPRVDLALTESMTNVLERRLAEGDIDAAILATPLSDDRLTSIPLYDEPFWIALPHGHRLESQETIEISDIQMDDLLLLADGHCLRDQVLSFCQRTGSATNTQDTSLSTILALVGAGEGVTLVPATSLQGSWVTDAGIAVRREASGMAQRSVSLAFRASYPRREILEKLADIICAVVPDTVSPSRR